MFVLNSQVFHDVAYKAKSVEDLLAGIDEFMDQVTVLPPGEYKHILMGANLYY